MGLEPEVVVEADVDGDSAWSWWKWMSKYRVWEANRKVFLWPENWIEPELKIDRSQFFKDLTGPFYGANRPGSKVSQGLRAAAK